jgi:Xaa-Pro aminopeptidase
MTKAELPPFARSRLAAVRKQVNSLAAQGMIVTNMVSVRWLSGFTGSEAALLITARGHYILVDSRYTTQAGQEANGFKVTLITRKPGEIAGLCRGLKIQRLAFESDGMTHARFLELKKEMKGVKLVPFGDGIKHLRAIKNAEEVRLIQRAADIARRAFKDLTPRLKPGMKESALSLLLETRMRELGSGQAPFPAIVASGPRGALPHGIASDRKMRKGELVTVDFGAIYRGYQSDQTITFCLGRPGKRQREIYEAVRAAHDRALAAVRPGASCKDVDRIARDVIAARGFGDYFGHGLGHGVGLETHEEPALSPRSKSVLEPGMVVTIEPGIYIPGFGGVRIEDMALVTKEGYRLLTGSGGILREL